jgi:sterol desaturase/sphingolipid hydroxylase (fatty acid hydroxylase superfamily)
MANQINSAPDAASAAFIALQDNLTGLFAPDSRLFLPYILTAGVLAVFAYIANRKHLPAKHKSGLFSYFFDRDIYFHPSSLVDLKLVLANRIFTPIIAFAGRAAIIVSAQFVAVGLLGDRGLNASASTQGIGMLTMAGVTLTVMLASDFTTYWVHRLHHENEVFWPFHKLHHSAETLTPITFARKHPIYDLFRALSNAAIVGPVQGVIFALFGVTDVLVILGVNAIYSAFHWTGSTLRHTHVWLSYGPLLSRILISPAQHQIHHSCAPEHHDTNYGEVFAFWDWAFGTLYTPEGYEHLEFGVADKNGQRIAQPHPTLKDAWLLPFQECAAALRQREQTSRKLPPAA